MINSGTKPGTQLGLPISFDPSLDAGDFLVAPNNVLAKSWIEAWPNWPEFGLILYGASGVGKTHLAHIWQKKLLMMGRDCQFLARDLGGDDLPKGHVIIDDCHHVTDLAKLFHLLNHLKSHNLSCLLLGEMPPDGWTKALPDLQSRLNMLMAVKILPPDDGLLSQILLKFIRDKQLDVPVNSLNFILNHIERSVPALRHFLDKVDGESLSQKRPISIALIRGCLP